MPAPHLPPQTPAARAAPARGRKPVPVATIVAAAAGAGLGAWMASTGQLHRPSLGLLLSPMAISLGLWLVLSAYWAWAGRNASEVRSEESAASRRVHLLLVNAAILLSFWPFAGWPRALTRWPEFPRVLPAWPPLAPIGLALSTAGLLLALWSRRELGRNWSGAVTAKVDHVLIRTGPYRRIRHPIYTGAIAMYVGTALISGRLQGPLAIALVGIAYARKIAMEERNLRELFGAAYEDYRKESWALIPGIL